MNTKHNRTSVFSSHWMKAATIVVLLVIILLLASYSSRSSRESAAPQHSSEAVDGGTSSNGRSKLVKRPRANPSDPLSRFEYIYDKGAHGRVLASAGKDSKFIPETDVASGSDLWLRDENGNERLISDSVYRAKFSPDGTKIAYTTSDAVLHVESVSGDKITDVKGAYDPDWKPDSSSVAFAKVPEGLPDHMPGALKLAVVDVNSGKIKELTDGQWDDVRPHYSPDGDWVLFVSGGRSGLASFWRVSADGGTPKQITNVDLHEVNNNFVPTPYSRSSWAPDKRWFVYDFKSGPREETWGLEFTPDGKFKKAVRIGEGVDPRWQDDGTLVAMKHEGDTAKPVQYALP